MTEDELYRLLPEKRKTHNQRRTAMRYMADEEKTLAATDLSELARNWRQDAGFALRPFDYEPMGVLTGDELELPKTMIKEIIRARRNQIYLVRARSSGKMLYVCSSCGELAVQGDQHRCLTLPWGDVKDTKEFRSAILQIKQDLWKERFEDSEERRCRLENRAREL